MLTEINAVEYANGDDIHGRRAIASAWTRYKKMKWQ